MSRSEPRGLFENPSFRAHLLWVVTGTTAAFLVTASATILFPLLFRFENAPGSAEALGRLADRILLLHATLWPLVFLCLISVTASSWLLYRRMVSPLVRFVQIFRAIRDGRIPEPVRLRSTDYLTREADELNAMTAALRERLAALAAARARLCEPMEDLAEWAASHGDAEGLRLLTVLQDREKALADQISRVVAA